MVHRFIAVVLTCAIATTPAIGWTDDSDPTPAQLVDQAMELWALHGDANGALELFNRAVDAAPDDLTILLKRGNFFELVAGLAIEEQRDELRQAARDDYQAVADADPESMVAGVARDALARIDDRMLFEEPSVECPPEALDAFHNAENLFSATRVEEAMASYATATDQCPASAKMLVAYGDAYYATGRYRQAVELFEQALAIDPWNRSGHRFLADTYARLGDFEMGFVEAAAAVVSDPTYEAAWAHLRSFGEGLGGVYTRVYGDRAEVREDEADADGTKNVTITLPSMGGDPDSDADGDGDGHGDADTTIPPDATGWMIYAMTKALALDGSAVEKGRDGEPVTVDLEPADLEPFALERRAVEAAIESLDDDGSDNGRSFWRMMASADAAGFLDEAIFLHLMDESLVDDYVAYREEHLEDLLTYLTTVIVRTPAQAEVP